ncbi:efflux RND transporter periplasmic adaptor subunit [Azohydromonas caseinilytica]|uniref:Efflux RND transporter periplasmic adaptor subunit n=1 Tax=Azohydromonas caseinilytica TaxID=2728836 RepID=A0A848F384_9BURK|nr:efflux RND transporter periplasmic adaptor subunit [Azohydromonas caseinilytica]NML14114.1 efflux RND transporter periplasmic adaptor subunit [Azohydromonas caseinilytica]
MFTKLHRGAAAALALGGLALAQAAPALPPDNTPEMRAQLSPRRFTTVAAEIGARVQRLGAQEGSAFKAGQTLVSFDCSLQQAQLSRVRVALDVATKQLATQSRLAELNATGRQEVETAEGEVAKQRAEIAQMQVMLSKCSVAAPFSGRVAEQKVREQQYVQPGQALLEIIDDSVLEVEFIMPSRWLSQVRVGSTVQIAVDETARTYPAKVLRLGARVDPVSQSVKVVAAIDGRPSELMAGMSGRLLINRAP